MENDDLNSILDTDEIIFKELEEYSVTQKFKSLFDTKKRLMDELVELNIKKRDFLKELKGILFNRDEKEKELKQLNELIEKEKELYPKEYEEYKKH